MAAPPRASAPSASSVAPAQLLTTCAASAPNSSQSSGSTCAHRRLRRRAPDALRQLPHRGPLQDLVDGRQAAQALVHVEHTIRPLFLPPNLCKRAVMRKLVFVVVFCAACTGQTPQVKTTPQDVELHKRLLVLDAHAATPEAIFYENYDFLTRHPDHHVDLPRMQEGGLDGAVFSVFVHPESVDIQRFFPEAMAQVDAMIALAKNSGGNLALAKTAAEVK